MILELKIDHTPDEAIAQIKDKKYALRFAPKRLPGTDSIQEEYWQLVFL